MKPLDVLLILISILFATGVIVDHAWGPERRQHRAVVRFQQKQLDVVAEHLEDYRETRGHYPTTEQGLDVVPGLRKALLDDEFAPAREFLKQSKGVRTIHGIPYLYENRADDTKDAFKDSPANKDRKNNRRFSRRLGQGVVVTSIGLRQDLSRVFGGAWLNALLLFSGGVIVFLAVAYIVARNRKSSGDRVRGINAMIIVGVAVLLTIIIWLSGGVRLPGSDLHSLPQSLGSYRTDLLKEYLDVMKSFADQGGLDPAALERIQRTLENEFSAAPAREEPDGPSPVDDDG